MKEWLSASELAGLPGLPGTRQNVLVMAKRQSWKSRHRQARGGGREWHISSLPEEAQRHLSQKRAIFDLPAERRHRSLRQWLCAILCGGDRS